MLLTSPNNPDVVILQPRAIGSLLLTQQRAGGCWWMWEVVIDTTLIIQVIQVKSNCY